MSRPFRRSLLRVVACAVAACVLAGACATPALRLAPAYRAGDARTYTLVARATTTIDVAGLGRHEQTELRAQSTLVTGATTDAGTSIRLTLTPTRFTRDGRALQVPLQQTAYLIVGPDGAARAVTNLGGTSPVGIEELIPLLGIPLPAERLHIGQPWTRRTSTDQTVGSPLPAGVLRGRISGLRDVDGYACAIVSVAGTRPVQRTRDIAGQPVTLAGVEFSTTTIAYAFGEGFPIRLDSTAETTFAVSTPSSAGGSVTITATTSLRLVNPRG